MDLPSRREEEKPYLMLRAPFPFMWLAGQCHWTPSLSLHDRGEDTRVKTTEEGQRSSWNDRTTQK